CSTAGISPGPRATRSRAGSGATATSTSTSTSSSSRDTPREASRRSAAAGGSSHEPSGASDEPPEREGAVDREDHPDREEIALRITGQRWRQHRTQDEE